MGLFDTINVDGDKRFTCTEGHLLDREEFQSKDFGATMGHVSMYVDDRSHVARTFAEFYDGGYGDGVDTPLLGRFVIYCDCRQCPAFVQAETGNICPVGVEFKVEIVDGMVRDVTRISEPTAEFLVNEPNKPYMVGCEGPMTYEAALERSAEIRRQR